MTDKDEQAAKFRDLFEKGVLDEAGYRIALKGLDLEIKDSQVGVLGDGATIEDGVHFDNSREMAYNSRAEQIQGSVQAEKIDNLALSYGSNSGWINRLWDTLINKRATYQQELEALNTIIVNDPMEIAKYYIEPDCQDVNPSDYGPLDSITSKEPMMPKIDGFFQMPSFSRGANQMFILSDAGMGKTALLTMLKLMELTSLWPRQKRCTLKKLGKGTLAEIAQIENRSGAILLLDSLDEDPRAYGRVRERLLDILRATKDFYKVIITCRTQFFPRTEADPLKRPGFFKIDEFTCNAKYLSFFSDAKVEQYLAKRFPKRYFIFQNKRKMIEARTVINKMGSLRCRPMLLSYIEDLMISPLISQASSEYHVYDALVQSWLRREKDKIPSLSEKDLLKACIILATMMQIRNRRSISENDLNRLIERIGEVTPIKAIDIKGRSLINRNSEGDYRFSHYSIQEFCVAKLLLEKPVFNPKGQIRITDFIFRQIVMAGRAPNLIKHLDFSALNFKAPDFDLKGLQLPGADLQGADFSDTNLSGADFSSANLKKVNFKNVIFKNVNLQEADFSSANFDGANFDGANFGVQLRNEPSTLSKQAFGHEFESVASSLSTIRTQIKYYFEDQGEVVLDRSTGLLWQKEGSNEELTRKEAQAYVAKINRERFADYADWCLPTLPELQSLLETEKQANGLYINPIFDKQQKWCWSADPVEGSSELAWVVFFDGGNVYYSYHNGNYYVRVVRVGQ